MITALFILAIVLALVEALLVPGFGLAGLIATACAIAATVMTYLEWGLGATVVAVALSFVCFLLLLWGLSRRLHKSKMVLHAKIDSVATAEEQLAVAVGVEGLALSRLTLAGKARFGTQIVEVRSEVGFIDEGTAIVVTKAVEGIVYVRPLS